MARLVSVAEYAALQAPPRSRQRVNILIKQGRIKAKKIGHSYLIMDTTMYPLPRKVGRGKAKKK